LDYLAVEKDKLTTLSRHNFHEADENLNIDQKMFAV